MLLITNINIVEIIPNSNEKLKVFNRDPRKRFVSHPEAMAQFYRELSLQI